MAHRLTAFLMCFALTHCIFAQKAFVDRSTDVLCLVPSATGLCLAIANNDKEGAIELGLSSVTSIAANYLLEAAIKKDRPDCSGHHSFPSTHSLAAFDGATFITKRYGWKWGVPAYAISTYVAWGRCYAKKHDFWDVLGGAALGSGCALIYTRKFIKDKDITLSPACFGNNGFGIYYAMRF